MPSKKIEIPGIGTVTLVRYPRSKNLRLSVTTSSVRVSMPRWTPYSAGAAFAAANKAWILKERSKRPARSLEAGQAIGKQHYLHFEHIFGSSSPRTRVTETDITVQITSAESEDDAAVQQRAKVAIARALKNEANLLLPPRLANLAAKFDFKYNSVHIKPLKRRWGSCSSQKDITLNLYLMDLSWEAIDYVLLHELTHTLHMHHGADFWKSMEKVLNNAKALAKEVRRYQPGNTVSL